MLFCSSFCKRLHVRSARFGMIAVLAFLCATTAFSDPIHEAARKGNLKKVKEILATDPKAISAQDNNGDTPLHLAALHGQYAVAEALIAAGANVNTKNSYPPFIPDDLGKFFHNNSSGQGKNHEFFSSSNHVDPVILLHSQASNTTNEINTQGVTAKDIKNNGYTPLDLAEFAVDHNKMLQLLIAHGADVNIQGSSGATPLFWAVMRDQKDDMKFLLAHGANPNLTNAFGDTPLICAVQLGYLSLVQPLVEKGADVNAQNQSLMRALGYAMQNPQDDSIVDYLKKHGAHQ